MPPGTLPCMKDPVGIGCTCSGTSSPVDEKYLLREKFPILCVKHHPFEGGCCPAHTGTFCQPTEKSAGYTGCREVVSSQPLRRKPDNF